MAKTGDFICEGYEYTGALRLLRIILSYDYLWINVRVKGGAYGCMNTFLRSGESYFVSYRDPNLSDTLDVYDRIPEYIKNFSPDEKRSIASLKSQQTTSILFYATQTYRLLRM